jgi:hypothetical protein
MTDTTDTSAVRSEILAFLRRELIGPDPRPEHRELNSGDEILRPQDPPRLRYSAGVLFPGGAPVDVSETATLEETQASETGPPDGEEPEDVTPEGASADAVEESTEHEVNRANDFLPSAMGLTALIRVPRHLRVVVRAGRYTRKVQADVGRPDKDGNWQPHHWRSSVTPTLDIDPSTLTPAKHVTYERTLDTGTPNRRLALHVYSRPYVGSNGAVSSDRIVTFTLINRTAMSGASPKDDECFFQCQFSVEADAPCFLEYPEKPPLADDEEEQSQRLLHSNRRTFAVGHGTAALWPETAAAAVPRIETDSLPIYEMRPVLPREIPGLELSMNVLSNAEGSSAIDVCRGLAHEYLNWIEQQTAVVRAPEFPEGHRATGLRHLADCKRCHERIVDGIDLLEASPQARQTFAWMNRAMLMQQLHYGLTSDHRRKWIADKGTLSLERPYQAPDLRVPPAGKGQWRPFQLGFILMNLRSLVNTEDPSRDTVDLIWFPTGGGKTEAYLGLAAFAMLHRRGVDPTDAGTTVLMRYTLRLLTTQQFQRAASLICACEVIRRENEALLGVGPVSIGLWVGQGVTPNKRSDAVTALNRLLREGTPNPFVVLACPWCAAEMGPVPVGNSYRVKGYRKESGTVRFRCDDPACEFNDTRGLPLLVVDEAIYEERPTLVIGTVDKFAMLPWNPEARRLFGLNGTAPVTPPSLIIQDELHLISGALGSMVGMYEGTIDALCTYERDGRRIRAKVIASTATIREAARQVHSLYARKVFLFPPQGLRAADSFFAEEALRDKDGALLPGRLYAGVFASALSSHVTAQVRVMSALLQASKSVAAPSPVDLDPYWTVMAYFNSLRELGHAATLTRADIREHLNAMWDRLGIRRPVDGSGTPDQRRFINRDLELTSRIQSGAISEVLQQLFNSYPGSDERRPVDVCLATNMIQVGLDVPRLGLMVVVGQPKTTSEYIQATSRVGRDPRGPGLVVVVLNPSKPRDRSHFEHFRSYHQSIYRWVEPTSVTPFAIPVRERALHAQLVTLARFWGDSALRERPSPPPDPRLFARVRETLIERIADVDPSEKSFADRMLTDLFERWRLIQPPIYGNFGPPPQEVPLMYPAGSEPRAIWSTRSRPTPSSMRNVDAGCDAEVIVQFPRS